MTRTVAVITGASSGIGAEFARRLAPEHDLVLVARRADRLRQMADEFADRHQTHTEVLPADLTDDDDLSTVADRLSREERLVLLVNNAGFGTRKRFWEAPLEGQEQMHKLHIMATLRLSHAALQNMTAADAGAIINVASVSAFVRAPGSIGYAASKSWMTAFTEGLYLELENAGSHVRVQALCPGFTYTEFHDVLHLERRRIAGAAFWMNVEDVVEASLDGLRKGKLFVIPGWRYRVLTALFSRLPTRLRLSLESKASQARLMDAGAARHANAPRIGGE